MMLTVSAGGIITDSFNHLCLISWSHHGAGTIL